MASIAEFATLSPEQLGERVGNGDLPVAKALGFIVVQGHLLIGTVVGKPRHEPGRPMNYVGGLWRPVAEGEDGTAIDVVRASRVPRTAIITGVLGDNNTTLQRVQEGVPLVDDSDHAMFGWRPDPEAPQGYRGRIARELMEAIERDPFNVSGAVDVVTDDGTWRELNSSDPRLTEPGHYVSEASHDTIGSVPLTGADLLALSHVERV